MSSVYPKGMEAFATGQIDWLTDDIKMALVDVDYVFADTDEFLDDVTASGGIVATSPNLASKTATNGTLDAASPTFSAVSGADIHFVVLYQDTGVAGTSHLIAMWDTLDDTTSLLIEPDGSDITLNLSALGLVTI